MPYVNLKLTMEDLAWMLAGGKLRLGDRSFLSIDIRDGASTVVSEALRAMDSTTVDFRNPYKKPKDW